MKHYLVTVSGTYFVNAGDEEECEKYLRAWIDESPIFNVIVETREKSSEAYTDLIMKSTTNYDITWRQ